MPPDNAVSERDTTGRQSRARARRTERISAPRNTNHYPVHIVSPSGPLLSALAYVFRRGGTFYKDMQGRPSCEVIDGRPVSLRLYIG